MKDEQTVEETTIQERQAAALASARQARIASRIIRFTTLFVEVTTRVVMFFAKVAAGTFVAVHVCRLMQ